MPGFCLSGAVVNNGIVFVDAINYELIGMSKSSVILKLKKRIHPWLHGFLTNNSCWRSQWHGMGGK